MFEEITALKDAILALFQETPVWDKNKKRRNTMRNHRKMAMSNLDIMISDRKVRFHVWDEMDAIHYAHRLKQALYHAEKGGADPDQLRAVVTLLRK